MINTNIMALNAYNNLQNTQMNLSSSLEKLSSGYRINGTPKRRQRTDRSQLRVRRLGHGQRP